MSDMLKSIDPRFAPEHAAFYIKGILDYTKVADLPFSTEGFPNSYTENKPLALKLHRNNIERNIYIAADDMPDLDNAALEWADVYGKVNLAKVDCHNRNAHKIVAIGPSHALKVWDLRNSLRVATTVSRMGGRLVGRPEHYRRFLLQARRRVDESYYEPGYSQPNYIFYNSWLWAKHPEANPPRADFIRACKQLSPGILFEGGFIQRRRNDVPGYSDCIANRHYSLPEYLSRVKRSMVAFNNPAAHNCLGWKLAEFLRLGKAIISLPLSRELPSPLVHREHVHIVDGKSESIRDAIREVACDDDYRRHLEASARAYYLNYLSPHRVIQRLANIAF